MTNQTRSDGRKREAKTPPKKVTYAELESRAAWLEKELGIARLMQAELEKYKADHTADHAALKESRANTVGYLDEIWKLRTEKEKFDETLRIKDAEIVRLYGRLVTQTSEDVEQRIARMAGADPSRVAIVNMAATAGEVERLLKERDAAISLLKDIKCMINEYENSKKDPTKPPVPPDWHAVDPTE